MALQNLQQIGMQQPMMQQPMMNQGFSPKKQPSFWDKIGQGANDFFLGKDEAFQQVPTQTNQGMEALQQLLSGGMKDLQNPYAGFDPIASREMKRFNTQTIPGLAERFTAGGGNSRQGSSAFQGALGSAGSDLGERLASLKSQYGMENRRGILDQLRLGLTPQFETIHRPAQPGMFSPENTKQSIELIMKILPFLI